MTSPAREVLATALKLSEADRAAIADELIESVEPISDEDATALLDELDRRAAELRADPSQGLSWDEVRKLRSPRRG